MIVAEVGLLHNGKPSLAQKLIDAASRAGADVVKFQTHIASAETLKSAPPPPYFTQEPRYAYFERTAFNLAQWRSLQSYCRRQKVEFLSSPFSIEAVELLEKTGVSRYKIPSGEITNLPFLEAVAETRKPVILSSGMSSWKELDRAVETITRYHKKLTILQCSSLYPCPYEKVGFNVMLEMKKRYQLPVGLSDHTMTNFAAFAAVTLGATVIEKHFTLNRKMYGSDAKHAAEPGQFKELADGIRAIERMCSSKVSKNNTHPYQTMRKVFQKSIVSLVDISKGVKIGKAIVGIKKPGTGIPPSEMERVIGRRVTRHIKKDRVLQYKDIQ